VWQGKELGARHKKREPITQRRGERKVGAEAPTRVFCEKRLHVLDYKGVDFLERCKEAAKLSNDEV
jgi:hypothetical protein